MKRTITYIILAVFLVSCAKEQDLITMHMGDSDYETVIDAQGGIRLRTGSYPANVTEISFIEGEGQFTETVCASSSQPMASAASLTIEVAPGLAESYAGETEGTDWQILPEDFYRFPDGNALTFDTGAEKTAPISVTVSAKGGGKTLAAGHYLLPLAVAAQEQEGESGIAPVFIEITVEETFKGSYPLYDGNEAFMVYYVNVSEYDPRIVTDYVFSKKDLTTGETVWKASTGNIVNLMKATLDYDYNSSRVKLNLSQDLTYVLENRGKYIRPLQESGRKICLCIEGSQKGIGFCNITDLQIEDFVAQIKRIVEMYGLDGINLWDRNSGYDKAEGKGFPAMNTTSYPKFVKALREALGKKKLLTLVDYEEPTEYFWDTKATDGIKVGSHLDYAWSGYCNSKERYQVIDPYHPDAPGVSALHPRKPIPGLGATRYGCINAPFAYRIINDEDGEDERMWKESVQNMIDWKNSITSLSNRIIVYDKVVTYLQNINEFKWNISVPISVFHDAKGELNDSEDKTYLYEYNFHTDELGNAPSGYGEWKKDW